MPTPLIEERPQWVQILRLLEERGARKPPGYRVRQAALAAEIGLAPDRLRVYVNSMEAYGLLTIRRTTLDGAFGSPRGFNIYRLLKTADDWPALAPAIIARRRELVTARISTKAKNRESEKKRKEGAVAPRKDKPTARVREMDAETVRVLAARYDDESDAELDGW